MSPRCMALFPQRLSFGHFWPKQVFSLVAFSSLPTTPCSENGWGPPFCSGSCVRNMGPLSPGQASPCQSTHRAHEAGRVCQYQSRAALAGGLLSPPPLPALVALPHAEPREEGGARHQDALGAENHTAAWAAAADPAPRTLQEFRGCVLSQARLQGSAKLILRPKDRYDSQSPPARDPSAASVLRKARSPERRGGAAGAPQGGLDRGGVSGRSPSPNRWGGASRGG